MRRLYLDSNVFISLIKREVGRGSRGLFVEAESFLEAAKKQDCCIVLSYWFFAEAYNCCYLNKEEILDYFKDKSIKVEIMPKEGQIPWRDFANQGLHFSDALHAAIALSCKCDCIVTFNVKDFEKIKGRINVLPPEEFD